MSETSSALRLARLISFRELFIEFVQRLSQPRLLLRLFFITLIIILLGATGLWLAEQALGGEADYRLWGNAFWYMISSVPGIGLGAKSPLTETGRTLAGPSGVAGSAL